jgi:hypothetical protein
VDGKEAQLARMGRQHRVTSRMGRRTADEEEGVVRLMGSAGGGGNLETEWEGADGRVAARSGGWTHEEAGVRRGRTQGTTGGRRMVVQDCGRRRHTHNE